MTTNNEDMKASHPNHHDQSLPSPSNTIQHKPLQQPFIQHLSNDYPLKTISSPQDISKQHQYPSEHRGDLIQSQIQKNQQKGPTQEQIQDQQPPPQSFEYQAENEWQAASEDLNLDEHQQQIPDREYEYQEHIKDESDYDHDLEKQSNKQDLANLNKQEIINIHQENDTTDIPVVQPIDTEKPLQTNKELQIKKPQISPKIQIAPITQSNPTQNIEKTAVKSKQPQPIQQNIQYPASKIQKSVPIKASTVPSVNTVKQSSTNPIIQQKSQLPVQTSVNLKVSSKQQPTKPKQQSKPLSFNSTTKPIQQPIKITEKSSINAKPIEPIPTAKSNEQIFKKQEEIKLKTQPPKVQQINAIKLNETSSAQVQVPKEQPFKKQLPKESIPKIQQPPTKQSPKASEKIAEQKYFQHFFKANEPNSQHKSPEPSKTIENRQTASESFLVQQVQNKNVNEKLTKKKKKKPTQPTQPTRQSPSISQHQHHPHQNLHQDPHDAGRHPKSERPIQLSPTSQPNPPKIQAELQPPIPPNPSNNLQQGIPPLTSQFIVIQAQKQRMVYTYQVFMKYVLNYTKAITHYKSIIENVTFQLQRRKNYKYNLMTLLTNYFQGYAKLKKQFNQKCISIQQSDLPTSTNQYCNIKHQMKAPYNQLLILRRTLANECNKISNFALNHTLKHIHQAFATFHNRIQAESRKQQEWKAQHQQRQKTFFKVISQIQKVFNKGIQGKFKIDIFSEIARFINEETTHREYLHLYGKGLIPLREIYISAEKQLFEHLQHALNAFKNQTKTIYSIGQHRFEYIQDLTQLIKDTTEFEHLSTLTNIDYIRYVLSIQQKKQHNIFTNGNFQSYINLIFLDRVVGNIRDLYKGTITKIFPMSTPHEELIHTISGNLVHFNRDTDHCLNIFSVKNINVKIVNPSTVQLDQLLKGIIFDDNRTVRLKLKDNDRAQELICYLNQTEQDFVIEEPRSAR